MREEEVPQIEVEKAPLINKDLLCRYSKLYK